MRPSIALFILFVAACGGPRINEAARANVNAQLAAIHASNETYAAPVAPDPLPFAAGQWIKQHVIDKDGNHSISTLKVLGVEGEKIWLENELASYSGTTATRLLIDPGNGTDLDSIQIYAYSLKQADGKVQEFPPMILNAMKPILQQAFGRFVLRSAPEGQEDVRVTAGTFEQAYKARSTFTIRNKTFTAEGWWHPAVPLNGGLKSIGLDPPGGVELIAFGLSGARTAF